MTTTTLSAVPAINSDGSISAVIRDIQHLPSSSAILRLWLPLSYQEGAGFGRFFLVRCSEDSAFSRRTDWSIYARRPLFCAGAPVAMADQAGSLWDLYVDGGNDPGNIWLKERSTLTMINLRGLFGQEFQLSPITRALLLLADQHTFPLILPLIPSMLDRGGRVVLLIKGELDSTEPVLAWIPIPVEVRMIPADNWEQQLKEPLRWADQVCAALPNDDYAKLAELIRMSRFKLDTGFAHGLITSDIVCGVGACLSCVVSMRDGSNSRACIHGPIFPLATLYP